MSEPSLLSFSAFRNFWFGRLATTAANQIFSLVIGWEIYEITGSAWYLGMAGLVQFLPVLVSFAIAGDLADRLDRRRILIVVTLANACLGAVLWFASLAGSMSVELLLIVCAFIGLLRPFQMASTQALTALLVPPKLLTRAIALGSGGSQAMFIAAPALGGFVLIAGPVYVHALLTGVCLLGTLCFFLARYTFVKPLARPISLVQIFGGFGFLLRERALLGVISLDLFAVMLASVTALLPVFAKDVLQADSWGLGLLRAAPAVGALLVSIVLAKWAIRRRAGKLMLGNVALFSIALIGFAFSDNLLLSLLLLAISGGADMVSVVIRQTMLQVDTPDEMRGRVSAVSSLAISGSNQLGDFRAGLAAYWVGASGAVAVGAAAGLLVALLWIRWFPEIWKRERLDER
jgi:MFS family permease